MLKHNNYPTEALSTNRTSLQNVEDSIVKVYVCSAEEGIPSIATISAHSFLLFETDSGEMLIARGGCEYEPRADKFGHVMGWHFTSRCSDAFMSILSSVNNWLFDKTETSPHLNNLSSYNFGRCVTTIRSLPEVRNSAAIKRSKDEDQTVTCPDTVNFHAIEQGKGIEGLKGRPNIKIEALTDNATDAQSIFTSAREMELKLNNSHIPYNVTPDGTAHNGINSHTVTSLILGKASMMCGTNFIEKMENLAKGVGGKNYKMPGATFSAVYAGASLNQIDEAISKQSIFPAIPNKYSIPTEWLMPTSGGPSTQKTYVHQRMFDTKTQHNR